MVPGLEQGQRRVRDLADPDLNALEAAALLVQVGILAHVVKIIR